MANLIDKVACVALVAAVMFPVGQILFPHVAVMGSAPFSAVEAVLSTGLGYGLYAVLFG